MGVGLFSISQPWIITIKCDDDVLSIESRDRVGAINMMNKLPRADQQLLIAVRSNEFERVREALDKKSLAALGNRKDFGARLVDIAMQCQNPNPALVRLLLERGAAMPTAGCLLACLATPHSLELLDLAVEHGANPRERIPGGVGAFRLALGADLAQFKLLWERLLELGLDPTAPNGQDMTDMETAQLSRYPKQARELVELHHAKIELQELDGQTGHNGGDEIKAPRRRL
jgi:hypothetical protein